MRTSFNRDLYYWKKRVSDSVFFFFATFGLLVYIPSLYMSILDNQIGVAIADSVGYLICIFLAINKKIPYLIKSIVGVILFYALGVLFIGKLGPKGVGDIWLFSSTLIAAFLIGKRGGFIVFIINVLTLLIFLYFINKNALPWQSQYLITPEIWIVKTVNFIFLNIVILIVNSIHISEFKDILSKVVNTRNASIIGIAKLAEYRDNNTGVHLKRLQKYSVILAEEIRKNNKYSNYITDEYISDLSISSLLHDIGKVGISDAILLKQDKLDREEFNMIKTHPKIGYDVIKEIEQNINGRSLYTMGKDIALYHHEKWDGSGYPFGLKGEQIPLSARIIAIVDVFDALTSKRPYKKEYNHDLAIEMILEEKGRHFDPDLVDSFIKISTKLQK